MSRETTPARYGRADLPDEPAKALRGAVEIEIFTIAYTAGTIALVATVLGGSQAMKTAWVEDMISLAPQIAFLIALPLVRRAPSRRFPYGLHRAMGVGHLVAGIALLVVGVNLVVDAVVGLLGDEHTTIGTVEILGQEVWFGWIMISVMALIAIPPPFYGRAKRRLAERLHNKLLYADADMASADWQTNAASIVGVAGIGLGIWWLDYVAALAISAGIIWDGWKNTSAAVLDLIDERARTYDGKAVHPLIDRVREALDELPWTDRVAVRMRDQGQVFHVEAFVVPRRRSVRLADIEQATWRIRDIDWKIHDVAIVIAAELPEEADE